jgi:hypothetical protein
MLLLFGASVNTVDSRGRTPLHCAVEHMAEVCGKDQPPGKFAVTNRGIHVGNSVAAKTESIYRTQANPWPHLNWSVELFGTGVKSFEKCSTRRQMELYSQPRILDRSGLVTTNEKSRTRRDFRKSELFRCRRHRRNVDQTWS